MHTTNVSSWWSGCLVGAIIAVVSASSSVHAAKLLVDGAGIDGSDCGGKTAPCRSISRAIKNAGADDTIVVGPGRYGDVDGDGNRFSPGDESGSGEFLILIDKPLTIVSRDGAGSTVIDGRDLFIFQIVRVTANRVTFGKRKQGFTIVGTSPDCKAALVAAAMAGPVADVTLAGNRAYGCIDGFEASGTVRVVGNQATGNSYAGFQIIGGATAVANEAVNNGNHGMYVFGAGSHLTGNLLLANGDAGILLFGGSSSSVLIGNVASGNETGIEVNGTGHSLTGNVAAANRGSGVSFNAGSASTVMTGNSLVGNGFSGVEIGAETSGPPTISKSNFIANGRTSGGPACGIYNFSNHAISAVGNFWGAETGPGDGPADDACNDAVAGSISTAPFATKQLKVKTKAPSIQ